MISREYVVESSDTITNSVQTNAPASSLLSHVEANSLSVTSSYDEKTVD